MPLIFSPLPHESARDRIAGLPLVTREVMDGLLPELKAYAFCITGIDSFDQLARTRDDLAAVPAGEATWAQAKKRIAADLSDRLGGKEATARAELLLRTHTFRGYAVARYRTLMAQTDIFPYWQYKTHGDGRVRPSHAALNGKILPAGHPVWQRIFPPWDWGCRCLVVPMLKKDVDKIRASEDPTDPTDPTARKGPTLPPEQSRIWDGDIADAIHKAERLPGGISTQVPPSWGASPWSEPGTVRHTWGLVQEKYGNDPELLRAFMDWAAKVEIGDGVTVSDWLDGAEVTKAATKAVTIPSAKLPPVVLPARNLAAIGDELTAMAPRLLAVYEESQSALAEAQSIVADAKRLSPAEWELVKAEKQQLLDVAKARLTASQASFEAMVETSRQKIEIPASQRGKVRYRGGEKSTPVHQAAQRGATIVERLVHPDLMPEVGVKGYTGRCKCEWDSTLRIGAKTDASTAAHEITHAIEFQNPAVLKAANEFLAKRAKGDVTKSLRSLTGSKSYRVNERAWEDEFHLRGGEHYCGKDYSGRATELLTMGIERLYINPIAFAANDREYFDFVVSTLQKL